MIRKRSVIALALIAAMAWGCGGSLNTTGTGDGATETSNPDTSTDLAVDGEDATPDSEPDVIEDVIEDVPPDALEDAPVDTLTDTGLDVPVDTAVDTVVDTAVDTTVDTAIDTVVDTAVDTSVDTAVDTAVDTPLDTAIDTAVDTAPDTAVDSAPDTVVDTIVDVPVDTAVCPPGTVQCSGSTLQTCRTDGSGWDSATCRWGCLPTPTAHCGVWNVSNIGYDVVDDGTAALGPTNPEWDSSAEVMNVSADDGSIFMGRSDGSWTELRAAGTGVISGIAFREIAQASGAPTIGVFSAASVDIPAGLTVWVTGDNAFALASQGAISISGLVNCKAFFDGSSMDKYPGPGGYPASEGPGAGGDGSEGSGTSDGGGGGAGFAGTGGTSGPGSIGGAAGVTYGSPQLIPLWGGSGGGNGADVPGYGGPGGGACEFVSMVSITIANTGGVDAAGHGGDGGGESGGSGGGGGGAGSGGGLLFESPVISFSGLVTANGGGGGSGAVGTYTAGADGERGHFGLDAALGGVSSGWGEVGCNGGNGNTSSAMGGAANVCETSWPSDDDGGGGGGAAGRIRLNGTTVTPGASTLSPAVGTAGCTQAPLPVT